MGCMSPALKGCQIGRVRWWQAANRDAALAFFPERVAITEKPLIEALLRHGFLARITGPCEILRTAT